MKLGYKALLLSAVPLGTLVTPLATPVLAQDAEMVEDDRTIIVTGTRRAERSSADTVAPVDVVGGDGHALAPAA